MKFGTKHEHIKVIRGFGKPVLSRSGDVDTKPHHPKLDKAVKEWERKQWEQKKKERRKKWEQRKKSAKRLAAGINATLDWIEGKPSKHMGKTKVHHKPKRQYVIHSGVAYPIYQSKKKHKKKKKGRKHSQRRRGDLLDIDLYW